jgi:prephenate dehydratase
VNSTFTLAPSDSHTQTAPQIAILGDQGTFHDIAARCFFDDTDARILANSSFESLIDRVQEASNPTYGLMAIENSLAGCILKNYSLLRRSQLKITGEVFLRIQHSLMTLPGQRIEDLKEVHSHPMAIEQCREFFRAYPHIRLVEAGDTASCARQIREKQLKGRGAIASTLAAEMNGLEVLASGIETNKKNYTRFWILQHQRFCPFEESTGKVSLCFSLDHESGNLHKVLSVFSAYQLNLTKIQSMPIPGRPWEYHFYLDFVVEGNIGWKQALEAIDPLVYELTVLGAYHTGDHFEY